MKNREETAKDLLSAVDRAMQMFRSRTGNKPTAVFITRKIADRIGKARLSKNTFGIPIAVFEAENMLIQVTDGKKTVTVRYVTQLLSKVQ